MPADKRTRASAAALCATLSLASLCAPARVFARQQTPQPQPPAQSQNPGYWSDRLRAIQLYEANNFVEALPILEKLYASNQSDVTVLEALSFILSGSLRTIKDDAERARVRARALAIARRARDLGDDSNLLKTTFDALEAPDSAAAPFSAKQEADAAMNEGEAAFARGDMAKAIEAYQRALKL
ncbi:MAG: tetratricopeptide repeat protein, partial [Acidobacteriota bacterium]|nr:tetratricopeptide repeat protein [Acidobacteriota bacterium]